MASARGGRRGHHHRPAARRAPLYIPYSIFNLVGGSWLYFYGLGVVVEVVLLAFILRAAWTWPRTSSASTPEPAAIRRAQIQTGR